MEEKLKVVFFCVFVLVYAIFKNSFIPLKGQPLRKILINAEIFYRMMNFFIGTTR